MLEETRRRLGLAAAERDRLLLQAGIRSEHLDPASYIAYHDERLIIGPHGRRGRASSRAGGGGLPA